MIKTLHEKIENLNAIGKIKISFITLRGEQEIVNKLKQPIYQIYTKLFINILKHAQAKEATLQIIILPNKIKCSDFEEKRDYSINKNWG